MTNTLSLTYWSSCLCTSIVHCSLDNSISMLTAKNLKESFQWSLKPLLFSLKFIGVYLDGPISNRLSFMRIILPMFCIFVLVSNVLINGPQGFGMAHLKEKLNGLGKYDSPFIFFKSSPYALVILVKDIMCKFFFAAVPVIHLVFLATQLLTRKWTELWVILEKIQQKMKLDEIFHRKCRKQCFLAVFLLVLVSINSFLIHQIPQHFCITRIDLTV